MAAGQMRHHPQLAVLVHQGHHALVDTERFQIGNFNLVFHIHQCVADPVHVILRHESSVVE